MLRPAALLSLAAAALLTVSSAACISNSTTPSYFSYTVRRQKDAPLHLSSSSSTHMLVSDVTASLFSDQNPVDRSLFGPLRSMEAQKGELDAYVHPRMVVGKDQWHDILNMYKENLNTHGTWAKFFKDITMNGGPKSPFIRMLVQLKESGFTDAYDGRQYAETPQYEHYRQRLRNIAHKITSTSASFSDTFVVCSLWANVALKQVAEGEQPFLPLTVVDDCINAAVVWAKIVLAHRTYWCNPDCPIDVDTTSYKHVWNTTRKFDLDHNWYLGGTGIGFTYDLLYDHISETDKATMRSAIAMFVMNRFAWGTAETCTAHYPNAEECPHRIFSNWAAYNSNLYLANLAIEGEDGFDDYASSILAANGKTSGFNQELHNRYSALLEAFMQHSFYPSGMTFEDGYSYFLAMREGSLGLLASHRRGSNVLGNSRFRNAIHNAGQMYEPWQCGNLIGHASGGGNLYNAHIALFRYAYPSGELPGMLWRQRHGNYKHDDPCRIFWGQAVIQFAFLGGEHSSMAESPQTMKAELRKHFKLSFYGPRRGLAIFRSSLSEKATYMHFDARPDAFIVGHDNADRGVFTFSSLRQTWIDDLPWKNNYDSRKHSLLHVDGLAEDVKAPTVRMLKVKDDGDVFIAAADLTYAYNHVWGRGESATQPPKARATVYDDHGGAKMVDFVFEEPEKSSPWDLGWPVDDRAKDIGFHDDMTLHGEADLTFMGIYQWKRNYRRAPLSPLLHVVRSTILVRSDANQVGYGIVVDSVAADDPALGIEHSFESYLVLHTDVSVDKNAAPCPANSNSCMVTLTSSVGQVDIHVKAKGTNLSFREEAIPGSGNPENKRLIIKSVREASEEIWLVFHPHQGSAGKFQVVQDASGKTSVTYEGETKTFAVDSANHAVNKLGGGMSPPVEVPSSTPAATASGMASPTSTAMAMASPSTSASSSPASTLASTPSASSSPSSAEMVEASPSFSAATTPSSLPSSSDNATPAASAAVSPTSTPSPSGLASSPEATIEEGDVEPMPPIALGGRRVFIPSAKHSLVSDKAKFFHNSTAPYQAVFRVYSKTRAWQNKVDNFNSCSLSTSVSTEFAVYDCGSKAVAAENYRLRQCSLHATSSDAGRCRGFRTRWKIELTRRKRYYLVVSITGRSQPAVLGMRHISTRF